MIDVLVDTSVWVDHFRRNNVALSRLLAQDRARLHPFVLGELACGTPPRRADTLRDLAALQHTRQASLQEVVEFIDREHLYGLGCGLVDISLLTSTLMSPHVNLWTMDLRLAKLAERFGVLHQPALH